MAFQDIRLPDEAEQGAYSVTPQFSVEKVRLKNGYSRAVLLRSKPLRMWNISFGPQNLLGALSDEGLLALYDFYMSRGGNFNSFRMRDWLDYQLDLQVIGTGDGSTSAFQIFKTYTDFGGFSRNENITKPSQHPDDPVWIVRVNAVVQTVTVDYTIDYTTGILTFVTPPASGDIDVTGYFDRHVSFDRDVKFDLEWAQVGRLKKVTLIEEP